MEQDSSLEILLKTIINQQEKVTESMESLMEKNSALYVAHEKLLSKFEMLKATPCPRNKDIITEIIHAELTKIEKEKPTILRKKITYVLLILTSLAAIISAYVAIINSIKF